MDQSLKLLMNKTQSESDRLYRLLVKNLNTQAGLRIIKDQPQMAIELYEKVLTNKREVLTDVRSFQVFRAHTLFNYMDLIKQQGDLSDEAAAKFDELETQLEICEQAYMQPCTDATVKSRREFSHKRDAVHAHLKELEKVNKNQTIIRSLNCLFNVI
jgi:NADH:ubiquinone oxidoreductase subunit D